MSSNFIFYQLFEPQTSTFTYLLGDKKSKDAILIDPVFETVERDWRLLQELELNLKYILETHIHADHITGAGLLRERTKAQTAVSYNAQVTCADIQLFDQQELHFGSYKIRALETPGHTNSCMSYYCNGMVFTGDSLMIRSAGRTDFQQGSAEKLFDSIRTKIFSLPDETLLYPGHDYKGHTHSSIEMEKKFNPRIGLDKSKIDFVKIMNDLKLDYPKKMDIAVPANMACGQKALS